MTVRLAILSAAHAHADAFAIAAETVDGATLVAVADDDTERGRDFADTHGIEYAADVEALPAVDAGVVCAANVDHRSWTAAAAGAGIDVLCEKPLATTTAEARAMIQQCRKADVLLGVAMSMRFNQPATRAKSLVDDGELGELQAIVGTNLLTAMQPGTWITDPELAGGGAIMDHTVHVLDLVRWITGLEVAEVYTETGTRFADLAVEDIALLSMQLTDGTPVTHDGSWRQPDQWHTWGDVTLRLIGTEGVIDLDCFDQTFTQTRDREPDAGMRSVFWGDDNKAGVLRDFVRAVDRRSPPAIPGEEGLRELQVVEAAYRSAEQGMPVPVEYTEE